MIPFMIGSKNINYFLINLNKEVKDLNDKNLKSLKIDRINIVKMVILPKAIYRFNVIHLNSNILLHKNCKNLKFHIDTKQNQHNPNNPEQ